MQKKQSGLTMTPTMWLYVDDLRRTGLYGDALSADLRTLLSAVDGDGWPERLKLLADDLDLMAKVAEHDALSPHREDRERALLEGYASGLKDAASDVRELFAPPVPEGGE